MNEATKSNGGSRGKSGSIPVVEGPTGAEEMLNKWGLTMQCLVFNPAVKKRDEKPTKGNATVETEAAQGINYSEVLPLIFAGQRISIPYRSNRQQARGGGKPPVKPHRAEEVEQ